MSTDLPQTDCILNAAALESPAIPPTEQYSSFANSGASCRVMNGKLVPAGTRFPDATENPTLPFFSNTTSFIEMRNVNILSMKKGPIVRFLHLPPPPQKKGKKKACVYSESRENHSSIETQARKKRVIRDFLLSS